MPKQRRRAILGVVILSLLIPIFYIASPNFTAGSRQQQYQYSSAPETDLDASAVLAALAQSMNVTELNHLRDMLRVPGKIPGTVNLPISGDDPLLEYLKTLENFTSKMAQIEKKLDHADKSLAAGDRVGARNDLQQLEELRSGAKPLIRDLYDLLGRVAFDYEIDTSVQHQKLDELSALFQNYSRKINVLSAQLGRTQQFISTLLTLNTTKLEVYVEETFFAYGSLKAENGTALVNRNVTVSFEVNQTIRISTDSNGAFNVSLSYPVGAKAGLADIQANYEPEGPDALRFLPMQVSIQVLVEYYPTVITADLVPISTRPTELAVVNGNLTDENGVPLENRTIAIAFDQIFLSNTTTGIGGHFSFVFTIPATTRNGTHFLETRFIPANDRFASTNTTLPFIVELIATSIQINLDRRSLLSGTSLTINGSATYENGTVANRGNITVYVDGQAYSTRAVNGTFDISIQLSLGLGFGSHSIQVTFVPIDPWVQRSTAVSQVYVFNTPIVVLAVVAAPTISTLGVYLIRGRRRRTAAARIIPPQPLPVRKTILREEFEPANLIATINAEPDHASKVRKTLRLAQAMIERKFEEPARENETHWEYYSRVSTRAPQIKDDLKRLVELFELTEYGPELAESTQSRQATEILMKLRREIEAVE